MPSSGMLRRVALVRTEVSEELKSSDPSVLTSVTRRNIPEDGILYRDMISQRSKIFYNELHVHL
jgi:hypothetical protein